MDVTDRELNKAEPNGDSSTKHETRWDRYEVAEGNEDPATLDATIARDLQTEPPEWSEASMDFEDSAPQEPHQVPTKA